jgi:hypothetical protein
MRAGDMTAPSGGMSAGRMIRAASRGDYPHAVFGYAGGSEGKGRQKQIPFGNDKQKKQISFGNDKPKKQISFGHDKQIRE